MKRGARNPGNAVIRVLIVDDCALMRKLMTSILSADPEIEVLGTAANPRIAQRKILQLMPDVVTLAADKPPTGALGRRARLGQAPPAVVVADLAREPVGSALPAAVIDRGGHPGHDPDVDTPQRAGALLREIKAAARAARGSAAAGNYAASPAPPAAAAVRRAPQLIAIGASTGGTEAIREILRGLRADSPGIVISQHIPGSFSHAFAERLDQNTEVTVCEAVDGASILPGHAYLAPGGRHLRVGSDARGYVCRLDDGPQVNRHKPSVDVMFESVAVSAGANAIGVLLTGMGDDGAAALGLLKAAGAPTIAQDQATSVVWGMPGEAVKRGHVDHVLPLRQIAEKIRRVVSERPQKH